MKKSIVIVIILWISLVAVRASVLIEYLKRQPLVEQIDTIPVHTFFREGVEVLLRQPLDHGNPSAGSFLQRVFISWNDRSFPVVFVTEGYGAAYGRSPRYLNELCPLLSANQVVVEHRYFGKSAPDSLRWEYLTVAHAAADHHAVVQLLKPFFTGQWINTGISKGGQTALFHRAFYPDDVDLTVSYVAPMNFGVEDGRHEPYIAKVSGTKADRKKVKAFQKEVLKRRDRLMPLFEHFIKENKMTFQVGYPEVYDYSVLEFSFAFWQYGSNPAEMPPLTSTDKEIFDYWMKISSPDYFSLESQERMGPYFVQAARELGHYGYDTRPFRRLLTIKSAKNYLPRLFLPEDYRPDFDPAAAVKTQKFLNTTHCPMIFIYGKDDPWSASGVVIPKKSTILKVVQEGGSHRARIGNLDEVNKALVTDRIRQVIRIPVPETVE